MPYLLSTPALVLVAGLVLGPVILLIRMSLFEPATGRGFYTSYTFTTANYAVFLERDSLKLFTFTAVFGLVVAMATVLIGFPLALFVRSLTPRCQSVALALVLIPKTAGVLATLFGLQRMLPRGLFAAIAAEVYLILPYAVLVLLIQLRSIDSTLVAAAHGLGASHWQTFRRVTLPLSRPGLILAAELGLIWGLSAFLGPLFLGGPDETTLSVEVHRQAFEYGRWPRAAAGAVSLLVLIGGVLGVLYLLRRRQR